MPIPGFNLGSSGSRSETQLYSPGRYADVYAGIGDLLKQFLDTGSMGNQFEIFGGQHGGDYWNAISKMLSGQAATDITGAVQNQMAPQYLVQLDKLTSALNPQLRGSGIQAQLGRDITTQGNVSMQDILANLRGGLFSQGTGMLGQAQTGQAGMNLQGLSGLQQLLAQLATVMKSQGSSSAWNVGFSGR